jgi:brefeldin A-inhibited guanine nucleotide-exchange protein
VYVYGKHVISIDRSVLILRQGIQFFLETGFIPSKSPQDIANFLLQTDGLSKAMIGEYLGDG